MSSDIDDTDEESDASVSTNVHPKAKRQSSDNTLKYVKKSAHNEGNVEDVMFNNLFIVAFFVDNRLVAARCP